MSDQLDRRLGLFGSVAIGMSAMIGAGLFVVFPPAAAAAGDGLMLALALAAFVAVCNAVSSARLAQVHPVSGGTYVYGREQLSPFWGYLAGWAFVAGKLASCAAMAFAVGTYAWPDHARWGAVAVVVVLTAVNLAGVQKSATAGLIIVTILLLVVAATLVTLQRAPSAPSASVDTTPRGVLQAAGLLFFAFAGYARLATLGEEVREPARTIPRAIGIAVVAVLAVYTLAAVVLLRALGTDGLAASTRPFVDALGSNHALAPVVIGAAALAAGGALLSLTLGVSRTTLALARDGHLPSALARIDHGVPRVAEIVVGAVIVATVLMGSLATSVAFSSFCVLVYYAVANASAWTLSSALAGRAIAALGLVGCLLLAFALPLASVVAGALVVALGALIYLVGT